MKDDPPAYTSIGSRPWDGYLRTTESSPADGYDALDESGALEIWGADEQSIFLDVGQADGGFGPPLTTPGQPIIDTTTPVSLLASDTQPRGGSPVMSSSIFAPIGQTMTADLSLGMHPPRQSSILHSPDLFPQTPSPHPSPLLTPSLLYSPIVHSPAMDNEALRFSPMDSPVPYEGGFPVLDPASYSDHFPILDAQIAGILDLPIGLPSASEILMLTRGGSPVWSDLNGTLGALQVAGTMGSWDSGDEEAARAWEDWTGRPIAEALMIAAGTTPDMEERPRRSKPRGFTFASDGAIVDGTAASPSPPPPPRKPLFTALETHAGIAQATQPRPTPLTNEIEPTPIDLLPLQPNPGDFPASPPRPPKTFLYLEAPTDPARGARRFMAEARFSCSVCRSEIGTLVVHGDKVAMQALYDVDVDCLSCRRLPANGAGPVPTRRRGRRATKCDSVECDCCKRRIGHGHLRQAGASSEDDGEQTAARDGHKLATMYSVVCSSCKPRYALCTQCGGGGG
ncbi:hypothetical protein BDK51DRAFT_49414, partial [Blyttiomyces helicus]